MKTTLPFVLIVTIFIFSCKKSNDSEERHAQLQKDTSEYFRFQINGGIYNNDTISIDKKKGDESILVYTGKGYVMSLTYYTRPVNYYKCHLAIDYVGPSKWNFSENTFQMIDLREFKNGPKIKSKSGIVTVTQFADSVTDYMTGTFKGTFTNIYTPDNISYQITEGKFRIKRRE